MEIWNKFSKPPLTALKPITAGRLKGKSDINPQWRYQAMTEVFGVCGIGWKYEIVRLWTEPASHDQIFVFAHINLYVFIDNGWSEPIPAIGGSMLIQKESSGLYSNDEGYKMAVTDALGTAMKMLGVGAEVYLGNFDGSKYREPMVAQSSTTQSSTAQSSEDSGFYRCYSALQRATDLESLKSIWARIVASHAYLSLPENHKESIRRVKSIKKEEFTKEARVANVANEAKEEK